MKLQDEEQKEPVKPFQLTGRSGEQISVSILLSTKRSGILSLPAATATPLLQQREVESRLVFPVLY